MTVIHNNFQEASGEMVGRDKTAVRSRQRLCQQRTAYFGLPGLRATPGSVDLATAMHPKATMSLRDLLLRSSLGERAVVDGFTAIRRGAVADELIHDREVRAPVVHIPRYQQGRLLSAGRAHRRGARGRRQGKLPIDPEIAVEFYPCTRRNIEDVFILLQCKNVGDRLLFYLPWAGGL